MMGTNLRTPSIHRCKQRFQIYLEASRKQQLERLYITSASLNCDQDTESTVTVNLEQVVLEAWASGWTTRCCCRNETLSTLSTALRHYSTETLSTLSTALRHYSTETLFTLSTAAPSLYTLYSSETLFHSLQH